jgi:hypothetical protein
MPCTVIFEKRQTMKKLLALLALIASLALASSATAGTTDPAPPSPDSFCAPNGCGDGGNPPCAVTRQYAGYFHNTIPPPGGEVYGSISDEFDYLNNGGFVASWIGVTDTTHLDRNGDPLYWIQGGLYRDTTTALLFYVEINGVKVWTQAVPSYNVPYPIYLYHLSNGSWEIYVNGHAVVDSNLTTADATEFTTEVWNLSSYCNTIETGFSGVSFTTGQNGWFEHHDYPYWTQDATAHGWTSVGP